MTTIIRSAIGSLSSFSFINFLKDKKITVIGTDIIEQSYCSKIVDEYYIVPKATDEKVIEAYIEICKTTKAKWILSGPENEIEKLLEKEEEFKKIGVNIFHPPLKTIEIITNKWNLYETLKIRFKMPKTEKIKCAIFENNKCVFKPIKGRGSAGVFFSKNESDFKDLQEKYYDQDYIVQQFISGKEYSVDTLFDMDSNCLNIVPRERLLVDSGISISSKIVNNKKLISIIKKLANVLKFRGGICFQFIEENEQFYLTDINPRFGGGSILSLNASKSFQNNLIDILNMREIHNKSENHDYKEISMFRTYLERYE